MARARLSLRAGIPEEDKSERAGLQRAQNHLKEGQLDSSLQELKQFWLNNPDCADAAGLCADIMDAANRAEAAQALTRLKEALFNSPDSENSQLDDHPKAAFEAGYHLIDSRQYELAVMLLSACLPTQPLDSTLNYELGFAQMALCNYEEAIDRFHIARKAQDDFDTTLNLVVCFTLSRKLKEAKAMMGALKKHAETEEEKHELHHREIVLKRMERLQKKSVLSERDWLYALYGCMEMQPMDGTASATSSIQKEGFRSIAATLLILKGVLEGLRLLPEAVEFYNPNSRPLAAVIARLLDVQLDSYKGPDRPDHALLVMDWATDIIGPHESFVGNTPNRSMFAFGLTREEALPVIPDIIARFTNELVLPWRERNGQEAACTPEEAIPEILERAWNMESDPEILRIVQDTVEYYSDKRELLVMANCAQFPQRAEYSAEVPNARQSTR